MKTQDTKASATKGDRKQMLLHLRVETILKLKSEALHTNRHAYEIVQELLDEHFSRQDVSETAGKN